MMTQAAIVDDIVLASLDGPNPEEILTDLPWIRTSLNDHMDIAEKDGVLSRRVSNRWSQDRMIKAVQRGIRKGLLRP